MSDETTVIAEEPALSQLLPSLPPKWMAELERVLARLPLLADLTRADVSLICPEGEAALIVGHATPALGPQLHVRPILGQRVNLSSDAAVRQALRTSTPATRTAGLTLRGVPVRQRVILVKLSGTVVGVLSFEKSLLLHHASSYPEEVLERPVQLLTRALVGGAIDPTALLTLLHTGDPIVVTDERGKITYLNEPALYLYHSLGLSDPLVGCSVDERGLPEVAVLSSSHDELQQQCELQIGDLILLKRVFPLAEGKRLEGALWVLSDVTELRRHEGALLARAAVMQELHHQVKNSLQMIASLLRMELRRADSPGAKAALEHSIARVMSIALVHDSLSREGTETTDLREMCKRLVETAATGTAHVQIETDVSGPALALPAAQATPVALLVSELATNAIKHAFPGRVRGRIEVSLSQDVEAYLIEVSDDGVGLPPGFALSQSAKLGLQIAQNLVRRDLGGSLELFSESGTRAIVRFPRAALEQRDG